MIQYLVEINPWEKFYAQNPDNLNLVVGDFIVLETEFGEDSGKILEVAEIKELNDEAAKNLIKRTLTAADRDIIKDNEADKESVLVNCKETAIKYGLDMKIVDCHFSLDGQRLAFAFIADGRIDFRELVKDLGRRFGRVIRLHQMGVRDEAKLVGNIGCCGETQCCRSHLKKLGNVTSEFAEDQQIVHRGSERLSGICGRLKCCLAFEENNYQELIKKLPAVGTRVKTVHGRGVVVGWHVLKCSVDVQIDKEKQEERAVIVEVPIKNKE
jgi:cell fate regulator YaaT (PSP1 superfamily)